MQDLLEKRMATHSSILAWRIPQIEESGGLQSMESHRVRHDWATNTCKLVLFQITDYIQKRLDFYIYFIFKNIKLNPSMIMLTCCTTTSPIPCSYCQKEKNSWSKSGRKIIELFHQGWGILDHLILDFSAFYSL